MRTKHAAMDMTPSKETIAALSRVRNVVPSYSKPAENVIPLQKSTTLSRANALYSVGRFMVFKSPEMPGVVDVYEIVADKKIRQIASFLRENEKYALNAAKSFLLTKV